MKPIEIQENGLMCDNPNCDFKDHEIKSANYSDWINKPCPKCGENLLTEADFINVRTLEMQVELYNAINKDAICSDSRVIVEVNTHNDISFGDLKPYKK